MPKVPGFERQVQQTGVNVGRVQSTAPIEAFGGGQAVSRSVQQMKEVGAAASELFQKAKERGDTAKLFGAREELDKIFEEKRQEVQQTSGENAIGLPEQVNPDIDKRIEEIQKNLSNDDQRAAFEEEVRRARKTFNKGLNDHTNREFNKVFTAKTEAILSTNYKNSVDNFNDPEEVKTIIQDSKDKYSFYAEMNGIPKEQRDAKLAAIESDSHIGVIQRLADGGADLKAKEYYDKNKKVIDPTKRATVEKVIEETSYRGEAQRQTQEIISSMGLSEEALGKARQIKDPKIQDDVVRRIKDRISEKKQIDSLREEKTFQDLFDTLTRNGGNLDSLPASKVNGLPANLTRSLEARAKELKAGIPVNTDLETYYTLEQLASVPESRGKFMQLNLLDFRAKGKLNDSDFKFFSKMQADMRENKLDPKKMDGLQSKNSIINDNLTLLGIDLDKNASEDSIKKRNQFRRAVDQVVVQRQEATGKKVSNEELRDIVDKLSTKVITDRGFLWNVEKPAFELSPAEIIKVEYDDVPEGERTKIVNALNRRGKPVTNEKVRDMYRTKLIRLKSGGK